MNRLKLQFCETCGAVIGPSRYRDFVAKRLNASSLPGDNRALCIDCARKKSAERQTDVLPPP